MTLRLWTAITIFLGSYLPLSLILLAQDFKYSDLNKELCFNFWTKNSTCELPLDNPYASLTIFFLCMICFVITIFSLSVISTRKHTVNITSSKYIPSELMNYTLPYIVSFMGVGYDDYDKFIGIVIFLIWIFWITHKSGQIILNPILVAFGWRLNEIEYTFAGDDKNNKHKATALFKGDISTEDSLGSNWIQDVMIIKAKKHRGK